MHNSYLITFSLLCLWFVSGQQANSADIVWKIDSTFDEIALVNNGEKMDFLIRDHVSVIEEKSIENQSIFIVPCINEEIYISTSLTRNISFQCLIKSTSLPFKNISLKYNKETNTFMTKENIKSDDFSQFHSELQCTDRKRNINRVQVNKSQAMKLPGLTANQLYSCKLNFTDVNTNEVVGFSNLLIINTSIPLLPSDMKDVNVITKAFALSVEFQFLNDFENPSDYYLVVQMFTNTSQRVFCAFYFFQDLRGDTVGHLLANKFCREFQDRFLLKRLLFHEATQKSMRLEINELDFSTEYTLRVLAVNEMGICSEMNQTLTTEKPESMNINLLSIASRSITLQGEANKYPFNISHKFVLREIGEDKSLVIEKYRHVEKLGNTDMFILSDLSPFTRYNLTWQTQFKTKWYVHPQSFVIVTAKKKVQFPSS